MDIDMQSIPLLEPVVAENPECLASDASGDNLALSNKRKRASNEAPILPEAKVGPSEGGPSARTRARVQSLLAPFKASTTSEELQTEAQSINDRGKLRPKTSTVPKSNTSLLHSNKPNPSGKPEVWSNNRAALCNALDYFQSHQGGTYSRDGMAVGLLIDSKVGDGDLFSSQVVITAIGGGCSRDNSTGEIVRVKSQDKDTAGVKRMSAAKEAGQAVVVIAGMGNKLWPSMPPHYYNVLDHFHVTDLWPVKTVDTNGQGLTYWMVRLEKVNLESTSWWTPVNATNTGEHKVGEYACQVRKCPTCDKPSKERYKNGWTCLESTCPDFFKFENINSQGAISLEYTDSFLGERTAFRSERPLCSLIPELPSLEGDNALGTGKASRNGIVCPICRCCSRRLKWEGWECETEDCSFKHTIPFSAMGPHDIEEETSAFKDKSYLDPKLVSKMTKKIGGYDAEIYYLQGEKKSEIAGAVTIFRATRDICAKPEGPDELFKELQEADIGLRRNVALHAGLKSEQVTSHFQSNWGAYYKFGVVVNNTKGFDEAPDPILKALHRLTWAGKTSIDSLGTAADDEGLPKSGKLPPLKFTPFNELLSLGYFETSVINYHDDGEKELSPTVATLSLGSPATMRFRPKKKSSIGGVRIGRKSDNGNKKPALAFTLNHGDIVVMHGTAIHKYYEHEVKPGGKLRYAMTSRHILLDRMDDPTRRQESLVKGQIPKESYKFSYHGEDGSNFTQAQVQEDEHLPEKDVVLKWIAEGEMQDVQDHGITSAHSNELTEKDADIQQA